MKKLEQVLTKLNPQVERAFRSICINIVNFILTKKGKTTLAEIEAHTGLHNINTALVANILQLMSESGTVSIFESDVSASVVRLEQYLKDNKATLPSEYNKLWTDKEYVALAKFKLLGTDNKSIAKELNRTTKSVEMQQTLLRKAYRLISIIEKNSIVKEFASISTTPKPRSN